MRFSLSLMLFLLLIACDSQDSDPPSSVADSIPEVMGFNPGQCSYELEGQFVSLHAGHHQQSRGDGASVQTTTLVQTIPLQVAPSNENHKSLVAVVLAHNTGGAGSLHYLAIAYDQDGACAGTNAQRLGERVSIESVNLESTTMVHVIGHMPVNDIDKSAAAKSPLEWRFRFEQGELLQISPSG